MAEVTRLTVKEAADRLRITPYAIRELCREGKLGKYYGKDRKTYLIYDTDIANWLGGKHEA